MAQEGPLGGAKEGVCFYVGSAGAGADAAELVFYEEFADEGFAEAGGGGLVVASVQREFGTYFDICGEPECSGKGTSSRRMFAKVWFRFLPLNGVVPNSIS